MAESDWNQKALDAIRRAADARLSANVNVQAVHKIYRQKGYSDRKIVAISERLIVRATLTRQQLNQALTCVLVDASLARIVKKHKPNVSP